MSRAALGIDIGSSRVKVHQLPLSPWPAGREADAEWVRQMPTVTTERGSLESILAAMRKLGGNFGRVHLTSVDPPLGRALIEYLREEAYEVHCWGVEKRWPIEHSYAAGSRPGDDRLLAAMAASWLTPGVPLIVIDAGTAVTVDLVDPRTGWLGGAIMPGWRTLALALASRSPQLFDVTPSDEVAYPGTSTESCLRLGLAASYAGGINRLVDAGLARHPGATIILTGGDLDLAANALVGRKVIQCRDLLHLGFALLEHHHV